MLSSLRLSVLFIAGVASMLLPPETLIGAPVTASREGTQVIFRAEEREILRYQAEPGELPRPDIKETFSRGGYLHPIYTPAGRKVTDDFPSNHVHHHGIWMPWAKTRFEGREPDFWNMGAGKGRVDFVAVEQLWQKDGRAGMKVRHRFVDLIAEPPRAALDETWEVVASTAVQGIPRNIIDFISLQQTAGDQPLDLPKYHYGGFGFRGNWAWNGPKNACLIMTSEGERDREKANGQRAKWVWVGGNLEGEKGGVTILCHPDNYRFPQPIRIHPSEPFFCYAPQQLGDMAITPGQTYVSRYRIIVADVQPTREMAESWWNEWTAGESSKQ